MRGYKVLYRVHGKLVSKADRRLSFPADVGQVIKMPGPGIFLSTSKQYVLDYYSDGPDAEYDDPHTEEVLLTLEFSPASILRGNLSDADSEVAVSSARVVAIKSTAAKRRSNPVKSKAKVLSLQAHRNKLAHEYRIAINKVKGAYLKAFHALGYKALRTRKDTLNIRSFNMLKDIAAHLYDSLEIDSIERAAPPRHDNPAEVISFEAFKKARARAMLEAKIVGALALVARSAQGVDPTTPEAQHALKFAAGTLIDGTEKGWFEGP